MRQADVRAQPTCTQVLRLSGIADVIDASKAVLPGGNRSGRVADHWPHLMKAGPALSSVHRTSCTGKVQVESTPSNFRRWCVGVQGLVVK